MTSAYLTCFKGRLTAESTVVVDGAEFPVPESFGWTEVDAQARIVEGLRRAGYRPAAPNLLESMSQIDSAGGYAIDVVKL